MLEAAVLIVVAKAVGVELSILAAVAITAFTILFQMFHITPGGIGVYEGVMAGALYAHGLPFEEGLALAALTHGLKFAYSYTIALAFTLTAVRYVPELNPLNKLRGDSDGVKGASRFEVAAARLWNVFNEGKPFTPVFVVGVLALLSLPHITDAGYWAKAGMALLALVPLLLLFYRFDFSAQTEGHVVVLSGGFLSGVSVCRPDCGGFGSGPIHLPLRFFFGARSTTASASERLGLTSQGSGDWSWKIPILPAATSWSRSRKSCS